MKLFTLLPLHPSHFTHPLRTIAIDKICHLNKFLAFLFILLTFFSCQTKKIDVQRISISPTVINNDLATKFPGEFMVDEKYFYTPTMLNSGSVVSIFDLNTGDEIIRTVNIGKGPQEFITPKIQHIYNGNILICDLNLKRQALFPVEQALVSQYVCHELPNVDLLNYTRVLMIDDDNLVFLQPGGQRLFHHLGPDSLIAFGEKFLDTSERNAYTLFQGQVSYHKKEKKLVYSNFFLPYISTYDYSRGAFLLSDQRFGLSRTKDDRFKYDKSRKGISDLTLTKDYIVCNQRDYENDATDEATVGRDFSKLSQTVFLYDLSTELISIVDLGSPVLRIASSQKNNDLYAIVFREDKFQVVKYQLPKK